MIDGPPQRPEDRERTRAFTHKIRDRFSIAAIRHGRMRMWLFLLVVVFIFGILIFGIAEK
jgi:heme/copper-type cytochrome/quinol oxidase subunit 3